MVRLLRELPYVMINAESWESSIFFRQLGEGYPLVLVHELMATGEMSEPVMGAFAERHRAVVPDFRGHRRSVCLPGPYTLDRLSHTSPSCASWRAWDTPFPGSPEGVGGTDQAVASALPGTSGTPRGNDL
jgi:pimeloyl-ACP methyl ester carboxylesterase